MLLLNPGPVTLTPRVRNTLTRADICHREPEFGQLQTDIRARLAGVYGLDGQRWATPLISGSGTAAVEAMLGCLAGADDRLLVIENGVYGERMAQIAERYGIAHDRLRLAWGEAVDARTLNDRLDACGARFVAVVHHETTTGRLNDLETIGACARVNGAALLVDAVSSFGAEAIDFDAQPIAAVAATANKCLHGAPGAAFVLARRDALARGRARSLYLDLATHEAEQAAGGTAFTPAVPAFYALAEALAEHADEGGWAARRARYRGFAARVAEAAVAGGAEPLLAAEDSSCVLRAFYLPSGIGYAALHDHLKAAGFVIYAGQGPLAGDIFRISTMGALQTSDIERLAQTLTDALSA